MSFIEWMKKDSQDTKVGVVFLISAFSFICYIFPPGMVFGMILLLISEYIAYRKSEFSKNQKEVKK